MDEYFESKLLDDRLHITPEAQLDVVHDYVPQLMAAWAQLHPEVRQRPAEPTSWLASAAAAIEPAT